MAEQIISFDRMEQAVGLFGSFDENIRQVQEKFRVDVVSRGSELKVSRSSASRRTWTRPCARSTAF